MAESQSSQSQIRISHTRNEVEAVREDPPPTILVLGVLLLFLCVGAAGVTLLVSCAWTVVYLISHWPA